jgi:DNA polymerase (family 10)
MTNRDIAAIFDEVADLLEFQNANPFRVRAYRNAARRIGDYAEPLSAFVQSGRDLTEIDGIGKDLAEKIAQLVNDRKLAMLEELKAQIPSGVMALLRIPGLGPKKAATLFKELKIESLDMLRAACEADEVSKLKGFGAKTQEKILAGIDFASHADERMYWAEADVIVSELLEHMRQLKGIKRIEAAGSYRRGRETIGDVDLLADSKDADAAMDHLQEFYEGATVIGRGDTKLSIRLPNGLQIDLRVVPTKSYGAALQYFTGSKDHNVILRGMAKDRGLKINEYGVFRLSTPASPKSKPAPGSAGGKVANKKIAAENSHVDGAEDKGEYIAGKDEADVYAALDLPCFPPEMREARDEFKWAAAGKLPKLIELADLQGDLHMHTTASDGKASIEEMAAAAQANGLKYISICDHSKRVSMANGLDGTRLRKQWKEIDRINKELDGFTVLKGVECDILEKGGMDLPDDVLAEADWVVASVHYGQNQPIEQITDRILGAIENPHVSIIAHPTGRLINRREAYAVDLEQVFVAAKKHGKFMELNANPARLDLDDVHCAAARRHGIPIVISSDAHSVAGLDVLRYGVIQARRGGLTKADVANTRSWPELKKLLGKN